MAKNSTFDDEIKALATVLKALAGLTADKQAWILATVSSRITGAPAPALHQSAQRPMAQPPVAVHSSDPAIHNGDERPRDFMRRKAPVSDVQHVACLAYYLTHYRQTPHFKSADLSALNTEAAGHKINMSRAMNNATLQNHYLASAGGGRKQITSKGEDVANALPSQEAVKAAEDQPGRRRAVKKKAVKKAKLA